MNDDVCTLHRGSTPLLVSLPHVGTVLTEPLRARLVERALGLEDTDWHLERLYGFVRALGASLLVARHSRYLIDLNRPPENAPMYPGVNNTELCPTPPRCSCASRATGGRTTTRSSPRSNGCTRGTATWCCSTAKASRASCRGCSRADC